MVNLGLTDRNSALASCYFKRLAFIIIILINSSAILSCQTGRNSKTPREFFSPALSVEEHDSFKPLNLNYIAILPLSAPVAERFEPGILEKLSARLVEAIGQHTSIVVANVAEESLAAESVKEALLRQEVIRRKAEYFGRKLDAQGVLYGVLTKYHSRDRKEGTKLGSYSPPGVSFTLWLLDLKQNEVVWTAKYEVSQKPISENILSMQQALSGGLGYRDAQQLAIRGFNEAAQRLERSRSMAEKSRISK